MSFTFTKETTAIFYNLKALPIQQMLDFDYMCNRRPSVSAIVHPGRPSKEQRFLRGTNGRESSHLVKGKYVELAYTVKGMDVSFSGLLTKAQQLFERKQASKEDLCFSLQETAFAMCAEVAERALAHSGKKELLLVGGVGANKRFCDMLDLMCKERGAKFYKVPMDLAGDQGAMIAWEGFLRKDSYGNIKVNCEWRADEV